MTKVKTEPKPVLEGHALRIYLDLLPKCGGDAKRAAREAIRLAAVFEGAVERAERGNPDEPEPSDPYAELDTAYCPNLSADHHLNRLSRYMPKPCGKPGELMERPNLDGALDDARKANKMTGPQRAADHKRCVEEFEREQARDKAAAEQKRIAEEEAQMSFVSKLFRSERGLSTESQTD